jgi:hypothetical protein
MFYGSKEMKSFEEDWEGHYPKMGWIAIDKRGTVINLMAGRYFIEMKTAEFWQFTQRASLYTHFTESLLLMIKTLSKCNWDIQCFTTTEFI